MCNLSMDLFIPVPKEHLISIHSSKRFIAPPTTTISSKTKTKTIKAATAELRTIFY